MGWVRPENRPWMSPKRKPDQSSSSSPIHFSGAFFLLLVSGRVVATMFFFLF